MLFENELIRCLVGIVGLVFLLYGGFFLLCVSFIAWTVVRIPQLERILEEEKDAHRKKVLTKKVNAWRDAYRVMQKVNQEMSGVDMPPQALLRALLIKRPHLMTRSLLFCFLGTASLLWAFGYFG